jgi:protein-tyrosine-phosphatase
MGGAILFVCTGNFCRSPMAEALLKSLLQKNGKKGKYQVRSAGTWTREGLTASPLAVQAMQDLGLDISEHRSHHLTVQDVEEAAVIIVMTRDHKEALAVEFPLARHKLVLLSELADARYDVTDPSGSASLERHRACAQDIKELLQKGYARLLQLAERDAEAT